MSEDKITKAVNDKKRIMDFEREVEAQSVEVFDVMKQIFTEVLTSVHDHEVSITPYDNLITAKVYDTTIGCARLNGVAMLRDEKLVNASTLEEMQFMNSRSLILDETYSNFLTGMIVIYVQSPGTRKGVVSRFYVNKDKQVAYRQHFGWHAIEFVKNDLSNKLKPLIEASIETALFEGEAHWNHTHQVFDSVEELGLANEIGFRK